MSYRAPQRADKFYPGYRLGFLILRQRTKSNKGTHATRKKWVCDCICGNRITVPQNYLVRTPNPKRHCGCQQATFASTHKKEYSCWYMMKVRCNDPKHKNFKDYGGRGIKVCDRWMDEDKGLENFVEDMGRRPSMKHTLDRMDVNGMYTKDNCRWATWDVQNNNKRMHIYKRS